MTRFRGSLLLWDLSNYKKPQHTVFEDHPNRCHTRTVFNIAHYTYEQRHFLITFSLDRQVRFLLYVNQSLMEYTSATSFLIAFDLFVKIECFISYFMIFNIFNGIDYLLGCNKIATHLSFTDIGWSSTLPSH